MTTKVIIINTGPTNIQVSTLYKADGIVECHHPTMCVVGEHKDFYVHQFQELEIKEL